jgi:hypothetical protein
MGNVVSRFTGLGNFKFPCRKHWKVWECRKLWKYTLHDFNCPIYLSIDVDSGFTGSRLDSSSVLGDGGWLAGGRHSVKEDSVLDIYIRTY